MKHIALLLLALFVFDVLIDSADLDCASQAAGQACHSCLCQNHGTGPIHVSAGSTMQPAAILFSSPDVALHDFLFVKGIFRPPQIPA